VGIAYVYVCVDVWGHHHINIITEMCRRYVNTCDYDVDARRYEISNVRE
jgi:hypothetical protein